MTETSAGFSLGLFKQARPYFSNQGKKDPETLHALMVVVSDGDSSEELEDETRTDSDCAIGSRGDLSVDHVSF